MNLRLFIGLFTLLLFYSVKGQTNKGLLQNFVDPRLFNLKDSSCINLSGEWLGEETEFYDNQGKVKGKYNIRFILTQQGNKVSGNSRISFNNGQSYGNMKIRGLVSGNKLYFEEYEIVDEKFTQAGALWCLRTGELDIKVSGNFLALEGANYKGYAAYYYFDCQVYVNMRLGKTLLPKEIQHLPKESITGEELGMQLQPNPANHEVTLLFQLVEDQQVRVDMFSLSGELIANITNGQYTLGKHQQVFSLNSYAAGVYLIQMQAGKQSDAKLLVIAR